MTVYSLLFNVYSLLFTVYSLLFNVFNLLFNVFNLFFTVYNLLFIVTCQLCAVNSVLNGVCVLRTVFGVRCAVVCLLTLYFLHFIVNKLHIISCYYSLVYLFTYINTHNMIDDMEYQKGQNICFMRILKVFLVCLQTQILI